MKVKITFQRLKCGRSEATEVALESSVEDEDGSSDEDVPCPICEKRF